MILEVSRGHIKVELLGKRLTVPGEMFFPPDEKMGFVVFEKGIKSWDEPNAGVALTKAEVDAVIEDIRQDFAKGGHTLEVE